MTTEQDLFTELLNQEFFSQEKTLFQLSNLVVTKKDKKGNTCNEN